MRKLPAIIFILITSIVHGQSVKVMTYNIRYDNAGDGVNQWSQRTHKVYDLLKKYNPDIIGIQEALLHQIEDIIANVPAYGYVGVGRDDGKMKGEYSAILYKKDKYDIIEQNTFWLSESPDVPGSKSWDAAITRIATWAKFSDKKSRKPFVVVNTHFDHVGKEARKQSAALLASKAEALAGSLPLLLTGDFNCKREDPPYAILTRNSTYTLIDPAPLDPPGTFCTFTVNSIPCSPIDYVFHSKDWKVKSYQVITDNDGKHYPSDHLPVMISAKVKK